MVAVTCGEEGVQWLEYDRLESIAAINVPANDTTGAGDVFHGALAFALAVAPKSSARSLLTFANQVAARKVIAGKGIMGAPHAQDLQTEITSLLSTH